MNPLPPIIMPRAGSPQLIRQNLFGHHQCLLRDTEESRGQSNLQHLGAWPERPAVQLSTCRDDDIPYLPLEPSSPSCKGDFAQGSSRRGLRRVPLFRLTPVVRGNHSCHTRESDVQLHKGNPSRLCSSGTWPVRDQPEPCEQRHRERPAISSEHLPEPIIVRGRDLQLEPLLRRVRLEDKSQFHHTASTTWLQWPLQYEPGELSW